MSKVLSNNNTPEENLEYLKSVLPTKEGIGANKSKLCIDWKNSIGCTIEYEYEWYGKVYTDSLTISRYETKRQRVCFEGIEKSIKIDNLTRCKLGGILNLKTDKFKFKVGDIINGILIIGREYRTITTKNHTQKYKYYKYRCTCTNEDWIREGDLLRGHGCNACCDGVSYPEKFMYSVLSQLNIKFETQYSPEWLNSKQKYDFYLSDYNTIIETHGEQHYRYTGRGRSLQEEQENDRIKEELALNNGIKNYIVIDCRKSEINWIKEQILNSDLVKLFDLSTVNWDKCNEFALKNLVKEVCDYWHEHREINGEDITTKDVSKIFGLDKTTVIRYLQKGTKLGWCNYDPKEEQKKNAKVNGRQNNQPIYCEELNRIFTSITDAERKLKINHSNISSVLNGKRKTSGKLPNGTKLHWQYVDKNSNYYKNYLISKQKKVA